MKRIPLFAAVTAFVCLALAMPVVPGASVLTAAHAQNLDYNGSLGNLYQNLYLSTHLGMGSARSGRSSRRRRTPRVSAPAKWTLNPKRAAILRRVVAAVPAPDRVKTRAVLEKTLATYPAIARAASQGYGVPLRADDPRDAAALAGTLSFEELSGKDLTNAQFAANRALSRRLFASEYIDAANMQDSGETYALAIGLMALLKAYSLDPKNPDPDLTRRQLRGLAQDTFRVAYRNPDYTKFAPTSKGLVKVR
ncbi:MAG: hypothetical protein H7Z41_15190 [Cytophagales bacterium]|nr:hypothetical protein [Armatimonadota bacterium]